MEDFNNVTAILDQIINDRTVPKNIRKAAEDSKVSLSDGKESVEVRISTAIHILDEIINDPNMPMYTRTQIWSVCSLLEEKRRELV